MNASIFSLLAGDLDHQLIGADVDDPAPEDLDQRLDLGPVGGGDVDLDQHQVALDVVFARDVENLDDRDDLLELLADLLEVPVVAHHHDGDPREVRVLGLADREAVDVEPARGEHARDLGQDARLVLHQGRQQMALAAGLERPGPAPPNAFEPAPLVSTSTVPQDLAFQRP